MSDYRTELIQVTARIDQEISEATQSVQQAYLVADPNARRRRVTLALGRLARAHKSMSELLDGMAHLLSKGLTSTHMGEY